MPSSPAAPLCSKSESLLQHFNRPDSANLSWVHNDSTCIWPLETAEMLQEVVAGCKSPLHLAAAGTAILSNEQNCSERQTWSTDTHSLQLENQQGHVHVCASTYLQAHSHSQVLLCQYKPFGQFCIGRNSTYNSIFGILVVPVLKVQIQCNSI